jgi:hypothetical protein
MRIVRQAFQPDRGGSQVEKPLKSYGSLSSLTAAAVRLESLTYIAIAYFPA